MTRPILGVLLTAVVVLLAPAVADVGAPTGWAIAELHLLIRDALAFEDGQRLVLLAGVPAEWFERPMKVENLPTHFGPLSLTYTPPVMPGGEPKVGVKGVDAPGGVTVATPTKTITVNHPK